MEQKSLSIIENKLKVFSNKYKELIDELEAIGESKRSKMLELILDKRKMRKEFLYDLEILAIEITFFNKEVIRYYGFYDKSEG